MSCSEKKEGRALNMNELNIYFQNRYRHGKLKIKAFETELKEEDFVHVQPYRHEFNNRLLKKNPLSLDEIIPNTCPRFRNQHEYLRWKMEIVAQLNTKVAYITSKEEFIVKMDYDVYELHKKRGVVDIFANYKVILLLDVPLKGFDLFSIWLQSHHRLMYNTKVCNPHPMGHEEGAKKNEFNVFKGFLLTLR